MKHNRYPARWNEERVRQLLQHYETQTEEEAVAEDEAAFRLRDQTVMVVPKILVPKITRMIATEGLRKQRGSRPAILIMKIAFLGALRKTTGGPGRDRTPDEQSASLHRVSARIAYRDGDVS